MRDERHAGLTLSVVVPAYNEEKLLAATLETIARSVAAAGWGARQWELRVVDNASSDATAAIAADAGAVVVFEPQRQIARARNAGARDARGRWLLFVDADTRPSAALLTATRGHMASGRCCGGGALVGGQGATLGVRALIGCWNTLSRSVGLACGAYLFCRRDAFRELGGFSQALYAAEEVDLSWRLRRWGRRRGLAFAIVRGPTLETSLRKLDLYSPAELGGMALRAMLRPHRALRDRRYLDAWYDGRR